MNHLIIRSLIGLCFLLAGAGMQAQEKQRTYNDRIYIENGSIIVGEVEQYDPEGVTIVTLRSGIKMEFSSAQVKRVIMHKNRIEDIVVPIKVKKIYNETQISILSGVSGNGVSLAHNIMYQYNRRLSIGVGTGIDNYYVTPGRDIYPIFANAKINITNGTSAPYVGAKFGYGMAFKKESEDIFKANGGMMANPYFGIRIGSRGMIINLFSGLKFQKADYEIIRTFETRVENIFFKRLEIGTSVMF